MLNAHLKRERLEGKEIHPAARTSSFTEAGRADDDCKCYEMSLTMRTCVDANRICGSVSGVGAQCCEGEKGSGWFKQL